MGKRTWHSGPPPHVGWWNASFARDTFVWRWWDGTGWSTGVQSYETSKTAGRRARQPALIEQRRIRWSDHYPANARVPRINPAATSGEKP